MMRLDDWEQRLEAALTAADKPFQWGAHDCCTFAAMCVEAVTGLPIWIAGLSAYTDAAGARRALVRAGYDDLPAALDAALGPRKPAAFAQRGDVAVVTGPLGAACVVVDLSGERLVGVSPDGVARLPIGEALAAWSVG